MINIKFFASLREKLDCSNLEQPFSQGLDVFQVIAELSKNGEQWRDAFEDKRLIIAINHEVSERSQLLSDGDELAFFPPVTGG